VERGHAVGLGPSDEQLEVFAARGLLPTDPIVGRTEIAAGAAEVWSVISAAGNLVEVHPFCAANPVERWPGHDGRDHVHYFSGLHYQRDVLDWLPGVGYDLAVGPPSDPIAVARWRIDPAGSERCGFAIEVTSFLRDDVGEAARARYERSVIHGAIPPYLDAVVHGVAHRCETGTPVVRNQFGPHDLYSPAVG
jgi:hypothetical protein